MVASRVGSAIVNALAAGTIAVVGEALIDLVETGDDEPRLARPGGSPYNIAVGLARLDRSAAFVGRISRDLLGDVLRRHASRSGVDLSLAVDAAQPSTVALVEITDGVARYRFGIDGTADFRWTDAELARVPDDVAAVHFGSLASWTPPGDAAVLRRVTELNAAGVLVTYDPNVRPHLQPDAKIARDHVERALPSVHLAKTSDEDLAHLYPDRDVEDVARHWLTLGPRAVVITCGGDGAIAITERDSVHLPVRRIEVVDTVGAGDSFMSGLLDALADHDALTEQAVATLDTATLGAILDHAALLAAITCSRAGANPPRRAEVAAYRAVG